MTREDIIRMAREAGFYVTETIVFCPYSYDCPGLNEEIEKFAKLVAAAERDACAKASEAQIERWVDDRARYAASECAVAIRARSQA